jgi:hypothetical protein
LVVEKYLFQKEIEHFFSQNPNYKYVVDAFTLIAFWGFGSCLFGIISYFVAKEGAKKLKKQVRQAERELITIEKGKTKESLQEKQFEQEIEKQ